MAPLPSKINKKHIKELQSRGYCIINEIGNGTYSRVFKAEKINDDNTNTRNARNEQTRNSKGNSKGNFKGTSTGGSSRASGLNSETSTETNNTEIYTETKINDRENNEREAADVSIKKNKVNCSYKTDKPSTISRKLYRQVLRARGRRGPIDNPQKYSRNERDPLFAR